MLCHRLVRMSARRVLPGVVSGSRGLTIAMGALMIAAQIGNHPVCQAAEASRAASSETSRMATYGDAADQTYFALSITPNQPVAEDASRQLVVLFDTSASQINDHRTQALEALASLMSSAAPGDQFSLVAVDLESVALTKGFVAADSPEMQEALKKLHERTPLGSTDMVRALRGAIRQLQGDETAARRVVYIGDGASRANMVDADEMQGLIESLAQSRVSVSTLAIGAGRDVQWLAAVANHTGGHVVVPPATPTASAQELGEQMGALVRGRVLWPTTQMLPKGMVAAYPHLMPAMPVNRDTILVGKLAGREPQMLAVTVDMDGEPLELKWTVQPESSNPDHAYLPRLVELAQRDQGRSLPTPGSVALWETRRLLSQQAQELSQLGEQALKMGDLHGAKVLADAARKQSPLDPQAATLHQAVTTAAGTPDAKRRGLPPSAPRLDQLPVEGVGELLEPSEVIIDDQGVVIEPPGFAIDSGVPLSPDAALLPLEAADGKLLRETEERTRLRTDILKTEVRSALIDARKRLSQDPAGVRENLKLMLENVNRAADIHADVREQMQSQLHAAIVEAGRREVEKDHRDAMARENQAVAQERLRITDATARDRERMTQILDAYNSLMEEFRFKQAHELAVEAQKLDVDELVADMAREKAEMAGAYYDIMALRQERQEGVMAALWQVEKSFIPFADDPPIVYPAREVWRELTRNREKYNNVDLSDPGPNEKRILEELEKPTTFDFSETPLAEAVGYINELHDLIIVVDEAALVEAGIDTATTVITQSLRNISLKSALRLTLEPLQLTYVIDNEVMKITTAEKAEDNLINRVYPVGDLVLPIQAAGVNPFSSGGGLGGGGGFGGGGGGFGGGGGGFGGGGGGFGGGGFGGGGLGGGGFGGGGGNFGGGGGFFNVADELKPSPAKKVPATKTPARSAFAVEDPIQLGKKAITKQAAINVAPQKQSAATEPASPLSPHVEAGRATAGPGRMLKRDVAAGSSSDSGWDRYLADHRQEVSGADIRITSQALMNRRQFSECVGLLQGALKQGFAEPWMYEGLALAMEANGAPQNEIERALMSAADFSRNTDELYLVARTLARRGYEARALQLFRDLAAGEPSRPEPYALGLALAEKLGDEDAIRWACVGVLGQAWLHKDHDIEVRARRSANALVESLEKSGKSVEATAFRAELERAASRDLVVQVSWTGDADIDLLVEEPSGTLCSLRQRRTTSGGVLVADSFPHADQAAPVEGYSESYVCPQAFTGQYRVLLRRVWGKVTSNKVNVMVWSNYGTDEQKLVQQPLPLDDGDVAVVFELPNGRRTEPLDEVQIATEVKNQLGVSHAVLAQQLGSLSDSQVLRDLAISRRQGNAVNNPLFPGFRGAVGFQPVITTLPEGTNFQATAVISADRRYVRVTATPLFSLVREVFTFNFATGATAGGGAGTGTGGTGTNTGGSGLGAGGGF